MKRKLPGVAALAAGALLAAGSSGPGVEWAVDLLNRTFDPGFVIRIMASPAAQILIDEGSPVRRFGPLAGLALVALGVTLLVLAREPRAPAEEPPVEPRPAHPEPIELAPDPPPKPAAPIDLPPALPPPTPDWFQSSPSLAAQADRVSDRTHVSANAAAAAAGPVRLPERYRLVSRIGSGAMGTVYRAHDTVLDRPVAIKVLSTELQDPESRERFLREARALAALSHPSIVILHDVGVEAETPYMVMELLEGMHLRDVLGDLPFLPERDVLAWGAEVADALACVHDHGLVHRDVKPENIMRLAASGRVKLMDFGIAHVVQSRRGKPTQPSGTPYYMAPEQIKGGALGPWTDIYGLGATLFALMVGSLPFPEGEPLYHAVHTPAPDPRTFKSDISAGSAALLLACLAKEPAARPQRAADLAAGLRELAGPPAPDGIITR
ncbi:MAG TPA: serine/threonine-protein kinase [Myxococcales bacterium]|nr:serine/threonine-protein kinase [Myxococcales bacterium]